jgi:hypothetical protein
VRRESNLSIKPHRTDVARRQFYHRPTAKIFACANETAVICCDAQSESASGQAAGERAC